MMDMIDRKWKDVFGFNVMKCMNHDFCLNDMKIKMESWGFQMYGMCEVVEVVDQPYKGQVRGG